MSVVILFSFSACTINAGENAYQIACKNGFSGTEAEWLQSLKGKDGKEGIDGIDGINGVDGTTLSSDYTAKQLYDDMIADGSYQGSYSQFIKEFFNVDINIDYNEKLRTAINKGIFCSCNIISEYVNKDTLVSGKSGGSGIFFSLNKETGDSYVITNFHVVYNSKDDTEDGISDDIKIYLYSDIYFKRPIQATYVGGSSSNDIAVLRITKSETLKNSPVCEANFSDSELVAVGDTVLAVGNPQSKGTSVTQGMINVDYETLSMKDVYGAKISMRVMRIDAAVNPGNSGGGLFDIDGNVVGIVNAKLVEDDVDNVGYAIPSNIVSRLAESIIYYCSGPDSLNVRKAKRPLLGITVEATDSRAEIDEETNKYRIIEDVVVSEFNETSPVKDKFKVGDLIKSFTFNDKTYVVNRKHILSDVMLSMRANDSFEVLVSRIDEQTKVAGDVVIKITITEDFLITVE